MFKKASKLDLLFFLMRNGAHKENFIISTTELANELGISQQSASRWLIELEKDNYLERTRSGIRLTPNFMARCGTLYGILQNVFEAKERLALSGKVMSGTGDGRYYISMPGYRSQVRERLGFMPFPGTLNIALSDRSKKAALLNSKGIELKGFFKQGRMLGAAKCLPCVVNGRAKGAVILPMRSHYGPEVLEIVSAKNLRKELGLKDGSHVSIEVSQG